MVSAAATSAGVQSINELRHPPEQAFRFSARAVEPKTIEARFDVADGYYLYRDKLRFSVAPGGAALGTPDLPAGARIEIRRGQLALSVVPGCICAAATAPVC